MPKSMTLTLPSDVSMMLPGLMSRCTRWFACEYWRADRTPDTISMASLIGTAVPSEIEFLDRVPLNVLHDDVGHCDRTAGRVLDDLLAGVVHGDDVRVIQRRCRLCFATEARLEDRVLRQVAAQHLDGDDAR